MQQVTPIHTTMYDQLRTEIYRTDQEMGQAVALRTREIIGQAIAERGVANITLSIGKSHQAYLETLREMSGIDWARVNVFIVDISIGTPPGYLDVAAYLRKHLIQAVRPGAFYPIASLPVGTQEVERVCWEYAQLLRSHPSDLVVAGWGFSGHMALNDPPYTTFDDPAWVKAVRRAHLSRVQSVVEGSYQSVEEVPNYAITMTIPALLATRELLCQVAGPRKADIVRDVLLEPISEDRPGSVLRRVPYARLFLDQDAASKL